MIKEGSGVLDPNSTSYEHQWVRALDGMAVNLGFDGAATSGATSWTGLFSGLSAMADRFAATPLANRKSAAENSYRQEGFGGSKNPWFASADLKWESKDEASDVRSKTVTTEAKPSSRPG